MPLSVLASHSFPAQPEVPECTCTRRTPGRANYPNREHDQGVADFLGTTFPITTPSAAGGGTSALGTRRRTDVWVSHGIVPLQAAIDGASDGKSPEEALQRKPPPA